MGAMWVPHTRWEPGADLVWYHSEREARPPGDNCRCAHGRGWGRWGGRGERMNTHKGKNGKGWKETSLRSRPDRGSIYRFRLCRRDAKDTWHWLFGWHGHFGGCHLLAKINAAYGWGLEGGEWVRPENGCGGSLVGEGPICERRKWGSFITCLLRQWIEGEHAIG